MKFNKCLSVLSVAAVLLASLLTASVAFSQGQSFDEFAAPLTTYVIRPQFISASASNGFVVDLRGFRGVGKLDIMSPTNSTQTSGTGATFNLTTSNDLTNWVQITNYALLSSNSIVYTNNAYGLTAQPLATNYYGLPGTLTTPTPATAGFATQYLNPAVFTNSGVITDTGAPISVGFVVPDQRQYLMVQVTLPASSTNAVSATLTANK